MSNELFNHDKGLQYVSDVRAVPADLQEHSPLEAKPKRLNVFTVFAIVSASLTVFSFFLLLPAVVTIALAVISLLLAVKEKQKLFASILLIVVGVVQLLGGMAVLLWWFNMNPIEIEERFPLTYSVDDATEIGYKWSSGDASVIQCDEFGVCEETLTIMTMKEPVCEYGGYIKQLVMSDSGTLQISDPIQFRLLEPGVPVDLPVVMSGFKPNEAVYNQGVEIRCA